VTAEVPAMDTELATFSPEQKAPGHHTRGFFIAGTPSIGEVAGIDIDRVAIPYTFQDTLRRRTIRFKRQGDITGAPGLPAEKYWVIDLMDPKKRLPTPVDDRGLIKIDDLIRTVKATIDADYEWPAEKSMDHFYYEEEWYRKLGGMAVTFRELSVHKGIVPRQFENVKHQIILPPAPPSLEVMHERIRSWTLAKNLFSKMQAVEDWRQIERRRNQGVLTGTSAARPRSEAQQRTQHAMMQEIMRHHFRGVDMNLEQLEDISPAYRLVEPDDAHDIIVDRLCRLVGAEALYLVDAIAA
jgi:hypothetical protein